MYRRREGRGTWRGTWTTSSPEATSECITHILESQEPVPLDPLQLETSKPSAATEEGASEHDPGEQTISGVPCDQAAAATSTWRREEKEPIHRIPKLDNPSIHQEDPLLDGVY